MVAAQEGPAARRCGRSRPVARTRRARRAAARSAAARPRRVRCERRWLSGSAVSSPIASATPNAAATCRRRAPRCVPSRARRRSRAPASRSPLLDDLALLDQPRAVALHRACPRSSPSADRERAARRPCDRLPVRAVMSFVIVHELDVRIRESVVRLSARPPAARAARLAFNR